MKKLLFVALWVLGSYVGASAQQRYAVIDTKYILDRIPAYKEADAKLKVIGEQWQKEIDDLQAQLDKMYKNYESEQFMLTEALKKKREDELFEKEKQVRDLQKKAFWLRRGLI